MKYSNALTPAPGTNAWTEGTEDKANPTIASAAWGVISKDADYLGRSYIQSTMFKVPAKAFAGPQDVEKTLPPNGFFVPYFQPVYNTGDIAAGTISTNLEEFGGVDVGPAPTGYGSEEAIIQSLQAFENDPNINVAAVEVQIKQFNGIPNKCRRYGEHGPLLSFPEPGSPSESRATVFGGNKKAQSLQTGPFYIPFTPTRASASGRSYPLAHSRPPARRPCRP